MVPTGPPKVRSGDTDYRFRPGSDFFWLTGEMEPNSVLVVEPDGEGHRATLYVEPPSDRSSHEFFTDARYGEFWIGHAWGWTTSPSTSVSPPPRSPSCTSG